MELRWDVVRDTMDEERRAVDDETNGSNDETTTDGTTGGEFGTDETTTSDPEPTLSRRTCLRGIAATGVAGGLFGSGAGGAAAASDPRRYFDRFDTVVDVVEAGADDTGRESVSSLLRDLCADDTLLVFPPGRYYLDEQVRFTGFDNFGLAGNDATLVPADYHDFDGPQYRLFRLGVHYSPGTDLLVDGFTVDQTAPDTGIRAFDAVVDDGLEVRNVAVEGYHDSGTWGPGRFNVLDPEGSGVVERFEAPDGAQWESETPNAGNIWRGPTGVVANMTGGTLRFVDCELGGFPDNGLYASGGSGRIVVDGGRFENSNGNSVRVGGTDSLVRGATVRVDETPRGFGSQRGVRIQNAENVRVEDTSVTVTASNGGSTAVVVENSAGESWFEGLDLTVDVDVPTSAMTVAPEAGFTTIYRSGIELRGPGGYGVRLEGADGSAGANLELLDIVGDVGDEGARSAIRNTRDGVRFGGVTVDQPGGTKRYALVNEGDDCTVYEGDYVASRYGVLDAGTGTWISSVYARSYGDRGAIALHDDSADVYLKNNTLRGGYDDYGCDGLKTVGNDS